MSSPPLRKAISLICGVAPYRSPGLVEAGLAVAERQLAHGKEFLLGDELSIADF